MHTDLSRTPRFRIVTHTTNVVCVHGVLIPIWDFSTSLRFAQNDKVPSTDTIPVIPNVAHARPILLNITYARCHSERSVCAVKNLLPLIMPLLQIKKDLVFTKSFLTSFLYRPNFGKNLRFLWDKSEDIHVSHLSVNSAFLQAVWMSKIKSPTAKTTPSSSSIAT